MFVFKGFIWLYSKYKEYLTYFKTIYAYFIVRHIYILKGWNCVTIKRSYAITYLSWFYIQYYDKWYNILLSRFNPFSFYYCILWFRTGYSFYTSSSICCTYKWVHQRCIRFTLIMSTRVNMITKDIFNIFLIQSDSEKKGLNSCLIYIGARYQSYPIANCLFIIYFILLLFIKALIR